MKTHSFELLNNAQTVDIISSSADEVLGFQGNWILAAINRQCILRYIQSKHDDIDNNPTIDSILYSFAANAERRLTINDTNYSCIIIDGRYAFESHHKIQNSEDLFDYVAIDRTKVSNTFERIWTDSKSDSKIQSVEQAINLIHKTGFKKGDYLFRGQINYNWEVAPSLFRKKIPNFQSYEAHYFRPYFDREHFPYLYNYNPLEFLVLCQHYGVPTRLLDATRDLLIALFFACYDPEAAHSEEDGKLYIMERAQFPELAFDSADNIDFKNRIDEKFGEKLTSKISVNNPSFFEPLIKNPRMRVQDGVFILFPFFSEPDGYLSLEGIVRVWNKSISDDEKKFWIAHKLVDKKYKKSILRELDRDHGINESFVFQDTILSKHLPQRLREIMALNVSNYQRQSGQ